MSKKTQFTRSKNKIGSLSWTSPIYTHGEGKYQNKILHDNILDIQDTTSLREVKYIQGGMLMVRVY